MARTTYPDDMLRPAAPVTYPLREPLLRQDTLFRRFHDDNAANDRRAGGRRFGDRVRDLDYTLTPHTSIEDTLLLAQAQEDDYGIPVVRLPYKDVNEDTAYALEVGEQMELPL